MEFNEAIIKKSYDELIPVNFGYENCAPGHSFGPAVRSFWLLHYVASGFGTFTRDGIAHHLGPGQIFVIPPAEITLYTADSQNPWTYHWVAFTCEGALPLALDAVITCPKAGEIFERMKNSRVYENGRSAQIRGLIWQLFGILLEQNKQDTDYIGDAISYMNTEYVNCITVGNVANQLGLNRSYFSSYFKKRMGISPQKYLMNIRMEKAADLLLSGKKPSIAAASVGYEDLFAFSKAFKRHFGVCPREYILKNSSL